MQVLYFGEITMTKYFSDKNKFVQDRDTPISVPNYERIEMDSREERYCPYCQIKLSRLIDSSGQNTHGFYCSKCVIEYPDKVETKSKSSLSTPKKSSNERPAVSYLPEVGLSKKDHSIKGGLKALSETGRIKIKSYKEGVG
jgi:hypothetical protein